VTESYAALQNNGVFAAGVPAELGGGGASHAELCETIREIAHCCSSTALALSMHMHLVASMAYMWRSGNKAAEPMLRRVATEGLILVSTGGSDWLAGSGKFEKVDGGYRLTGRKVFCSGAPAGHVLMTTGVYDDPQEGPIVFHVPLALDAPGVTVLDTWHVLGMRGTGSNDIQLEGVFIPDTAMSGVRRTAGKWHPSVHLITLVALPLIYAAYRGIAETARDLALEMAKRRKNDPNMAYTVGEMENQLVTAQLAHASLIELVTSSQPGPETTSAALIRRTILANAVMRTVDQAMEVAGGGAFCRSAQLERMFRDVQGARYHPLPEKPQTRYTGWRQVLRASAERRQRRSTSFLKPDNRAGVHSHGGVLGSAPRRGLVPACSVRCAPASGSS
jgi:alkylation response protein AidB-like acyl-CoA dehydrogenase